MGKLTCACLQKMEKIKINVKNYNSQMHGKRLIGKKKNIKKTFSLMHKKFGENLIHGKKFRIS